MRRTFFAVSSKVLWSPLLLSALLGCMPEEPRISCEAAYQETYTEALQEAHRHDNPRFPRAMNWELGGYESAEEYASKAAQSVADGVRARGLCQ